jgi:TonB family protein
MTDDGVLWKSSLAAFCIEALLLTAVGWNSHWLAHPQRTTEDTSNFIETQIFELPHQEQLVEKTKPAAPAKAEATLSKVVDRGRQAKPEESKVSEDNQTQGGSQLAPSHGPVAVFSPSPHIPAYLQDKELHANVVIDFLVSAQGHSSPRLVGSSGNEELDAIALETAKKWQFRPAEKDHQPIDAKVRLRIVFEVQ